MAFIQQPHPVKIFSAILYSETLELSPVMEQLSSLFGKSDHRSSDYIFSFTDYYNAQMKTPLKKFFVSFEKLCRAEELSQWKGKTNELEEKFSIREKENILRLVNIDPGYLTSSQLVLATTKSFSHRIYLRNGIYAEVTLNYKKGGFIPNPWTYPDYRTEETLRFFNEVRSTYMEQIKSIASREG